MSTKKSYAYAYGSRRLETRRKPLTLKIMARTFEPYRRRPDGPFHVSFYHPELRKMVCRSLASRDLEHAREVTTDLRKICKTRPLPDEAELARSKYNLLAIQIYLGRFFKHQHAQTWAKNQDVMFNIRFAKRDGHPVSANIKIEFATQPLLAKLSLAYDKVNEYYRRARTKDDRESARGLMMDIEDCYAFSRILIESGPSDPRYQTAREYWEANWPIIIGAAIVGSAPD